MAIRTDLPTDRITYTDQYVRIERINIINKIEMTVDVGVYINESATQYPPHRIESINMPFDVNDTSNLWSKAYTELKKMWPMAIDC